MKPPTVRTAHGAAAAAFTLSLDEDEEKKSLLAAERVAQSEAQSAAQAIDARVAQCEAELAESEAATLEAAQAAVAVLQQFITTRGG